MADKLREPITDVPAALVAEISRCSITDDGRHAVLQAFGAAGDRIALAFPEHLLNGLAVSFANASGASRRILGDDPDALFPFRVTRFKTGGSKQGDVVVGFEIPGGAELDVLLPQQLAQSLGEALLSASGKQHPSSRGTPLQ